MKADSNNAAYYYIFVRLIRENHNGTLYYIGLVQQCGQPSYTDAAERPNDNISACLPGTHYTIIIIVCVPFVYTSKRRKKKKKKKKKRGELGFAVSSYRAVIFKCSNTCFMHFVTFISKYDTHTHTHTLVHSCKRGRKQRDATIYKQCNRKENISIQKCHVSVLSRIYSLRIDNFVVFLHNIMLYKCYICCVNNMFKYLYYYYTIAYNTIV
jgi:hypothetical protein